MARPLTVIPEAVLRVFPVRILPYNGVVLFRLRFWAILLAFCLAVMPANSLVFWDIVSVLACGCHRRGSSSDYIEPGANERVRIGRASHIDKLEIDFVKRFIGIKFSRSWQQFTLALYTSYAYRSSFQIGRLMSRLALWASDQLRPMSIHFAPMILSTHTVNTVV